MGGRLRRARLHQGRQLRDAVARLRRVVRVQGPDQQKLAGVLSGGERNRLNLALTLKQGGNVLLLDEPTNDLDVETLQSLEDALLDFPGCAVVISHDRWFLDRVATHILAWEGTDEDPRTGTGSRATSPTTRRTRSRASVRRPRGRSRRPTAA
ncbi:ATP-binding cassette domain-containing protein [Tessaracoccus coleopterorum]|uniref:ATP-binding cassette domain-containing protein n=1 Tax=Tessaracoccus coleopterorum TaxID=2714950 RepID=UPI002F90E5B9